MKTKLPQNLTEKYLPLEGIDLANLGIAEVAYIKSATINGKEGFAIYAANGVPVALTEDRLEARATILQNNMLPVSVH